MKKLLLALFTFVALSVSAQVPQQGDTLRITTTYGQQYNYLFGNVKSLEFLDNSKVFINFYDNSFAGFPWSDVKSIRFHNRYSNPYVLLKALVRILIGNRRSNLPPGMLRPCVSAIRKVHTCPPFPMKSTLV